MNYTATNLRQGWSRKGSDASRRIVNILILKSLLRNPPAPGLNFILEKVDQRRSDSELT